MIDVKNNLIKILLVEDNRGDAARIEHLFRATSEHLEVTHVADIESLVKILDEEKFDVILLDLHLLEVTGVETVKLVREHTGDLPIIVLTGMDSDELAQGCIDAGAQDFLIKDEVSPRSLERSIDYAILRSRDTIELKRAIRSYRNLANDSSLTSITASISGIGPLREREPEIFEELVQDYTEILAPYLVQLLIESSKPSVKMEELITKIGDHSGGPRDLIDVHLRSLDMSSKNQSEERMRAYAVESRLLALEMMGLLVNYYRVGQRRFFK